MITTSQIRKIWIALKEWSFSDDDLRLLNLYRSSYILISEKFESIVNLSPKNLVVYSQRFKRLSSIIAKLRREKDMKLDTVQDLRWCRFVFKWVQDIYDFLDLVRKYHPELKELNINNYIDEARSSWYRWLHVIYEIDWYRIEMQLRRESQHARAMTVEIIDFMTENQIKSWLTNNEYSKLLKYANFLFADHDHIKIDKSKIKKSKLKIKLLDDRYWIKSNIKWFSVTLWFWCDNFASYRKRNVYFLLELDAKAWEMKIWEYKTINDAKDRYFQLESEYMKSKYMNVVLVSTQDLEEAYPSYFGDGDVFLKILWYYL